MSADLKNSILLWVGAIVFAGVFWAGLKFDLVPDFIPPKLVWMLGAAGLALNAGVSLIKLSRRRREGRPAERP